MNGLHRRVTWREIVTAVVALLTIGPVMLLKYALPESSRFREYFMGWYQFAWLAAIFAMLVIVSWLDEKVRKRRSLPAGSEEIQPR